MDQAAAQLYAERQKRTEDAIALRIPDRVPIWLQDLSFFPAKYTGITFEEMMCDSEKLAAAYKKTIVDFAPDFYFNPGNAIHTPGAALANTDCRQIKWPGHGVPVDSSFQFVEGEYMKADEYSEFIADPSDFVVRKHLPRLFGAFEPFKELPPLRSFVAGYFGMSATSKFVTPELMQAFKVFFEAGLATLKHEKVINSFNMEMRELGFPLAFGSGGLPPFDVISDTLRGMRGTMLDMYRQPDKLLEAIEKVTPFQIEGAITGAKKSGNPRVMIAIHRGSDVFMSKKQFETFYWPGFKKMLLALIEAGLTPCPFFEGNCTQRLEYFTELPRGKVLGLFDSTDIFKAKEILGNRMCIAGMFPVSLLQTGTPDLVKEYTRKLIDVVGKDGGFIMGPRSVMDEANPELVKIWVDYTKEYGKYR